jgi:hypothetical protein
MRFLSIIILSAALASPALPYNPAPTRGNRYGDGRTVAESPSTRHVQGREYARDNGTKHRRVLIYDKDGDFKGWSKLGRGKGDARTRHRYGK